MPSPSPLAHDETAEASAASRPARAATSEAGGFYVVYRPAPDPIPTGDLFEIDVRVYDGADHERAAAGAELRVGARMPAHGHGMNTLPAARREGAGHFVVEGMLFHMAGDWQIQITVVAGRRSERVAFDVAAVDFSRDELARIFRHSPLPSPRADPSNAVADDPAAARLGQYLFFDERLSGHGDKSCASCHDPVKGWGDGKGLVDLAGLASRHTPTLLNASQNRWYFWDGRADSQWSQALSPLENPLEQAGSRLRYAHLVAGDPDLRRAYESIFGRLPDLSDRDRFPPAGRPVPSDPNDPDNVAWFSMTKADRAAVDRVFSNLGKAIAAYERRIVSRDSPFDRFVEGLRDGDRAERAALSASARRGLRLFVGPAGCRNCHDGPTFSDGEFHDTLTNDRADLGRWAVPVALTAPSGTDLGRYAGIGLVVVDPFNGLGDYSDDPRKRGRAIVKFILRGRASLHQFKTPGLRSVAETAPYMHDGRFATLAEVVDFYSDEVGMPRPGHGETLLRPLHLDQRQKADLVAFLESLTGRPLAPGLVVQPVTPFMSFPSDDDEAPASSHNGEATGAVAHRARLPAATDQREARTAAGG